MIWIISFFFKIIFVLEIFCILYLWTNYPGSLQIIAKRKTIFSQLRSAQSLPLILFVSPLLHCPPIISPDPTCGIQHNCNLLYCYSVTHSPYIPGCWSGSRTYLWRLTTGEASDIEWILSLSTTASTDSRSHLWKFPLSCKETKVDLTSFNSPETLIFSPFPKEEDKRTSAAGNWYNLKKLEDWNMPIVFY